MIIQELINETWRFIHFLQENDVVKKSEDARELFRKNLQDLGYSESYIEDNILRIEELIQTKPEAPQSTLIQKSPEIDVWLVETLKKRLHAYLTEEKNMDLANALYIVSQFVTLDGRKMIRKYAHKSRNYPRRTASGA